MAASTDSAPELVKHTRSIPGVGPVHQRLGQQPGQQGAVELDQVGQVGVEGLVEGVLDHRVAPAQGEDPEPREEVEVAVALVVDQVGALAPDVGAVEADGLQDLGQLGVQELLVEVEGLAAVVCQQAARSNAMSRSSSRLGSGPGPRSIGAGKRTGPRLAHRTSRAAGPASVATVAQPGASASAGGSSPGGSAAMAGPDRGASTPGRAARPDAVRRQAGAVGRLLLVGLCLPAPLEPDERHHRPDGHDPRHDEQDGAHGVGEVEPGGVGDLGHQGAAGTARVWRRATPRLRDGVGQRAWPRTRERPSAVQRRGRAATAPG